MLCFYQLKYNTAFHMNSTRVVAVMKFQAWASSICKVDILASVFKSKIIEPFQLSVKEWE